MLLQSIFKISLRRRDHISMGDLFLFFYRGVHYLLGLSGLKVEWVTAAQVITDQITTENLHHLYTMDFWVIQWLQSLKRWKRKRYVISITYTFYTEYLKLWWLHFLKNYGCLLFLQKGLIFSRHCWRFMWQILDLILLGYIHHNRRAIAKNLWWQSTSFPNKRLKETELFI